MEKDGRIPPSYPETMGMASGAPPPVGFTGGYPGGQPEAAPATVIVTTVMPFGDRPANVMCPNCHAQVVTSTEKRAGNKAYLAGAILALIGCVWGCCLIPCCMDDCLDTNHSCPNCNAFLGKNS